MDEDRIRGHIVAELHLLATAEGGRKSALGGGAEHGCLFEYGRELYDCRLLLGAAPLAPGTHARVAIAFPDRNTRPLLQVGRRFRLRDSGFIGEGVIQAIL